MENVLLDILAIAMVVVSVFVAALACVVITLLTRYLYREFWKSGRPADD